MLARTKRDDAQVTEGAALFSHGMERAMVVQETKSFNEQPLRPEKCRAALCRLLYLLYKMGEGLSSSEATSVFFAVTKGFQSKDAHLRRLIYLTIKEMSLFSAQDIIMVIASITQDMVALPSHRAAAVRTLGAVIDSSMLSGVERVLRQAISDSSPAVASSALSVAILSWLGQDNANEMTQALPVDASNVQGREIIRRWLPDVQAVLQAATGSSSGARGQAAPMAQFHALALLYLLKQSDRGSVAKLVSSLYGRTTNPHSAILLLRIHADQLESSQTQPMDVRPLLSRAKGSIADAAVAVEAARLVFRFAGRLFSPDVVAAAVGAMQSLLSNSRPIYRHAAIRALSHAVDIPGAREHIVKCNEQLELAASDSNRTVATLAIATLLRTGEESSVDRLLSQISGYISDIADDFRIVVVEAIRALGKKFPAKHKVLLSFLGGTLLRQESGSLAFKEATVAAITELLAHVPAAREDALGHLCEFIEDCEYPRLTGAILNLLGDEGSQSSNPAKLVRYVYNRLVLEDSAVRLAAVGALSKIAAAAQASQNLNVVDDVRAILERVASEDETDDVRDRAIVSLALLNASGSASAFLISRDMYDLDALDECLNNFIQSPGFGNLNLEGVPVVDREKVYEEARMAASNAGEVDGESKPDNALLFNTSAGTTAPSAPVTESADVADMMKSEQIAALGELLVTGASQPLTTPDAEFVVYGKTHIFPNALVLEFNCRNTVPELVLQNVTVSVRHSCSALEPLFVVPIDALAFNQSSSAYVAFRISKESANTHPEAQFSCALRFSIQEVNPANGLPTEVAPYQDEYAVNGLELTMASYIATRDAPDFSADAKALKSELSETLELPGMPSIHDALKAVVSAYGLQPLHGTGFASSDSGTNGHTLQMAGHLYYPATNVQPKRFSIAARFVALAANNVAVEMTVRGDSPQTCEAVLGVVC